MTQAEEIAYQAGAKVGADLDAKETDNPYQDKGLRDAWAKGFHEGRVNYLDSQRYF